MIKRWSSIGLCLASLGPCSSNYASDTVPDISLLEFLGEWQDESGELIDPLLLDDDILADTNVNDILQEPGSTVQGDTE